MDPIQQPVNPDGIQPANWHIPPENRLRSEVKFFLETMRRQLIEVEPQNPHLPAMRTWRERTLQEVNAADADIHAILQRALPFLQASLSDPWRMEELFDSFVPEQLPMAPGFQEIALRRQCNHFVRDFGQLLQGLEEPFTDPLTNQARILHAQFTEALARQPDHTQGLLDAFVPLLQAILVDPLGNPLEEYSLLGSNGKPYGLMFLTLYYHKAEENRGDFPNIEAFPPFEFDAPGNFSAEDDHPVVTFLIQWLDTVPWQNGTAKPPEKFKAEYEALAATVARPEDLPMAPTRQDVEDRLFREQFIAQEQAEVQRYVALNARLQAILPLQQAIDNAGVQFLDMQARDIANIGNLREHFRNQFAAAREREEILRQQAALLQERVAALQQELNRLEGALNQADHSIAQLNIAIAEVARAIEDRKSSAFGDIFKSIAIIGVCVFASWGITMLIQNAMGVAATGVGAAASGSGAAAAGAGTAKGAASFGINSLGPKALFTPVRGGFMLGLSVPL